MYDTENIFAKILRGEIPCTKLLEDEHSLAFADINAQAPVHALVIPKGAYVDMNDFTRNASDQEIASLMRCAARVAHDLGADESGYRIIANTGGDANPEVPHLHIHILGGRNLGAMLPG